ncbi:MAG TPA: hypothetical protein VFU26_11310 [Gaiellaceae bacterium]|nr:hypothetical protein [Gaiellaceae bacterium]
MQRGKRQAAGLPFEVLLVWAAFAVVAVEVVVTYSRIPARDLYHVSGGGIELGLGRAVTFLNFPVALVALAVLALLWERLPGRAYRVAAAVAALLCGVVLWPGVVDEGDLDARWVNALPLAGVALALLLAAVVARRVTTRRWQRADWFRLGIVLVLLVGALPWLAADLGFYSNGVPLLGGLFQSGELLPKRPGLPEFAPAVHHGHHHGMDGLLLVSTVLLLSRRPVRSPVLAAYLSLMLCYGIGNYANDFWIEQVVKRGWTTWEIPNVLQPRPTIAWSLIVIGAVALWALWARLVDWSTDEESPLRPEPDGIPARR